MKLIIFDCYGTLFDEGKEIIPVISARIGTKYGVDSTKIFRSWKYNYLKLEKNFDKEFMTIIQANIISLTKTFNKFNLPTKDVAGFIKILVDKWSKPKLYADVARALTILSKDYDLAILSNTDNITIDSAINYSKLPIRKIITSEKCGVYKPNPEIFSYALKKYNCKKEEVVYVGNSPVDIIGSKKSGLKCIHLNRKNIPSKFGKYSADYVAKDMNDVITIIKNYF